MARRPLQSNSSRGSRRKLDRSLSKTIVSYAAPILLAAIFLILVAVYFFAIRNHSVELSFDQLAAFERQVTNIGNRSIYIVEPPRKDEILSSLPREDWARISNRIDYVAFVYDDPYNIINNAWLQKVSAAFDIMSMKGYGIVLFSCGCVIQNLILANTKTRFNGAECTMLPGFVLSNEAVSFIDINLPGGRCKNRDKVMEGLWYQTYSWKLEDARREHDELRQSLLGSR